MSRNESPRTPRWIAPAPASAGRVTPPTLAGRFVIASPPAEHTRELLAGMDRLQEQDATWHPLTYSSPQRAPFRLLERSRLASFRSKTLGRVLKKATNEHRWISFGQAVELPDKGQVQLTDHEVHIEQEKAHWIAGVAAEDWRLTCHGFTRADLLTHLLWTAPAAEIGSLLTRLADTDADRAIRVLEAGAARPEAGEGGPVRRLTPLLAPKDLTALLSHSNPSVRRACLSLLPETTNTSPSHPR